jgi:hypothetical protein
MLPPPFYPNMPFYGIVRKGSCTLPFVPITNNGQGWINTQPPVITIQCPGLGTYHYWSGGVTDSIAIFRFTLMDQIVTATDTWANLQYTLESDVIFPIPPTQTDIRFMLSFDGGPL